MYDLDELLDSDILSGTHVDAKDQVKGFVQRCLGTVATVAARKEMIIKPSVCTLGVSPHPRPDGVAPALDDDTPATRSVTELVYEVDSDNNWCNEREANC